jgi:hypothetical protein
METVIEISEFKLITEVDANDFLKASDSVQVEFLEKQLGFINRELIRGDDNQWMDIVHWRSREEADEAAKQAMNNPVCLKFFSMMDPSNIRMSHFNHMRSYP